MPCLSSALSLLSVLCILLRPLLLCSIIFFVSWLLNITVLVIDCQMSIVQCCMIWHMGSWGQKRMETKRKDVKNVLALQQKATDLTVWLSVTVQVIDCKDSSPK